MNDVIDEVRQLKSSALDARDAQDPVRAVRLLQQAETLLRETIEDLRDRRGDSPPGVQEAKAADQLVHILGSIGGVLRREGDYAGAVAAYGAGREIEQSSSGYGIVNSYTLVQEIVSQVFLNPRSLRELRLRGALIAARAEIERQIAGPRSGDEYAAADLALVLLLLRDPAADDALDTFVDLRPEPYAIDVVIELLRDLRDRTEAAEPELARRLDGVAELLSEPV